ncbi:CLK4-associating serine/arginine rich protein [Amyelois transitella]|uniref:CLK4-associating serine/arginine rich protein n=1 Tax=Amyelois transitella TaxID=680683 RepID=UPI00067BE2FE|nr:CLK4-associating serine/arginine rich protein [Amyelois transitella]
MWHEARKQERMIRGMIVDYRRRAERRKDFYEKIKAEPTQFLQLHGRPCKIHLDPAVAAAGEGPAIMMPWQGDPSNMIDRFDVRAHLDFIPEVKYPDIPPEELSTEERQCNYERYRILAQNAFLGISEDKFLQQLAIEEQFGVTIEEKEMQKEKLHEKKGTGAAIGYNYNDPGAQPSCSNGPEVKKVEQKESDDDSDLEIIDVDLSIDVNKMDSSQAHALNSVGPQFGMAGCDLFSFLTGDADDAEHQKQLLREEKEKAMFSGRKSRRERRAHRDKKLATRVMSPPSYAVDAGAARSRSASRSRSSSPETHAIQFITSFGDDEPPLPPKPTYSEKLKQNLKKEPLYSEVVRKPKPRQSISSERPPMGPHFPSRSRSRSAHSKSRSPSRSRSRSRGSGRSRSNSRARSHSKSRSRNRSISRSRSRSWRKSRSYSSRSRSRSYSPRRSRSRSRSRNNRNRRSRSRENQTSGYDKRNNSRSKSFESSDRGAGAGAVPRYYGRRAEDKSSSELSLDSDSSDGKQNKSASTKPNTNQNQIRLSGSISKGPSRETLSLKEKLKRKMQAQLSRQLKADKRAEAARLERESRRQARRDHEMRELAIKLRRRQREMRHQQNRRSSEEFSDGSRSRSSSRDSQADKPKEDRSPSKSPSPKPIPVWETNRTFATVPYKKSDTSENSSYSNPRRRQAEGEYNENRTDYNRPNYNPNRFERYPNSRDFNSRQGDNFNRYEHDGRWDQGYSNRRRPYGHRGGYRGMRHGEGHSSEYRHHDYREESDEQPKIKLVDY